MPGKKKEKKAASKSQQRLFGMVTAYKNGSLKLDDLPASLSKKIKSIADGGRKKSGDKRKKTKGITKKAAAEMASTKHKGLPETVKENKTLRFNEFINEGKDDDGYMDALIGGQAEDMTIEDIADKHGIDIEYIESIMPQAIEIEMEHTDDPEIASRIALDHLYETPLYYDEKIGLPEMEKELEELEEEEIEEIIDDRLNKKVKKFDEMDDEEKEENIEELEDEIDNLEEDIEKLDESIIKFKNFNIK